MISITNIYKPPKAPFEPPPRYKHPAIYSGDFNCHHISWGYSRNGPDGEALYEWSSTIDLKLLYDPNQTKTFHSAVWNTFTNPDLPFYTHDINSSLPPQFKNFPKSQHQPTIIYHPTLIEYTPTTPLPCWNFNKADWEKFKAASRNMCDDLPSPENDMNLCFTTFTKKLLKIAKDTIPRGFRKNYILKWDATCDERASPLKEAESPEEKLLSSNHLINHLNSRRKEEWISTVENLDMVRSSRKAWRTINQLIGRKNVSPNPNSISPNAVASCLLNNGKFKNSDKQFTREVNRQLKEAWNALSADQNSCSDFTLEEIVLAIKSLKAGQAPGVDNLHPEFFLHLHESCTEWLRNLFQFLFEKDEGA